MEIIAHRGASRDAPENTIAAAQMAWAQHADAIEIDIQVSRDDRVVVIHDATTRRTAGRPEKVRLQTLAQLRNLDAGRWKGQRWSGEKIPTLDEILTTVPAGKRLFIEVKCSPDFLPDFAKTLQRMTVSAAQIVVIGFSLETMTLVKSHFPALEVCWIVEFKRRLSGAWRPTVEHLISSVRQAGLDGLDVSNRGPVNRDFVEQIHAAGLKLYVWTVDSVARARHLAVAGLDGITTNRPGWLREKLAQGVSQW